MIKLNNVVKFNI